MDDGITVKSSHDLPAPWEFLSSGHLVRVRFDTDAFNSRKGFYLSYERGIYVVRKLSFAFYISSLILPLPLHFTVKRF